eukprot:447481-Pelagomonas_calceolata.AAC.12
MLQRAGRWGHCRSGACAGASRDIRQARLPQQGCSTVLSVASNANTHARGHDNKDGSHGISLLA